MMDGGSASPLLTQQDVVHVLRVVIDRLRAEVGPEVPAQRVLTLLAIAANPDLPQHDVPRHVRGIVDATVSRNVADLSAVTRMREPGPGLVEQRADPMYRRRNLLRLTTKGERLIADLTRVANAALGHRKAAGA
jgi:DNA-binding MarR family transcriptional regulator